jgi:DNA mismatch repair protein MSH3
VQRSVKEVITLDDDSDAPGDSRPDQPAAHPTSDSDSHAAQPSSRSAASIPARHAGRHLRFQQKLARPSPKEPAAGESAPKQPFTPLELQIVDLKRRHPGVLLVVEV